MRRRAIALGLSVAAAALGGVPAVASAAEPNQQATDSNGTAQVGSVEANAPVRVASDGNDSSGSQGSGS